MFLSKTRTIPSKLPVFVPGRPFQFSLMFASKARAYPRKLPVFVPGRPFQLSIVITIVYHQVGKRSSLPARCKRLREAASVFF